jgi:hypothetical protein
MIKTVKKHLNSFSRTVIIYIYRLFRQEKKLYRRTDWTAIGLTGNVSLLDEDFAKRRNLRPLNRLERWLMAPIIEIEQIHRRKIFHQARVEVLGEDPDDCYTTL